MHKKSHSQIHTEKGSKNLKEGNYEPTQAQRKLIKKYRNKKRRNYNKEEIPSI